MLQREIKPMLLPGRRKFDLRLYVLITDRAPYAVFSHFGVLRLGKPRPGRTDGDAAAGAKEEADGGSQVIDKEAYITNLRGDDARESGEHWLPHEDLEQLLDSAELRPQIAALGLSNGTEAYRLMNMNTWGAVAQTFEALRETVGTKRVSL